MVRRRASNSDNVVAPLKLQWEDGLKDSGVPVEEKRRETVIGEERREERGERREKRDH